MRQTCSLDKQSTAASAILKSMVAPSENGIGIEKSFIPYLTVTLQRVGPQSWKYKILNGREQEISSHSQHCIAIRIQEIPPSVWIKTIELKTKKVKGMRNQERRNNKCSWYVCVKLWFIERKGLSTTVAMITVSVPKMQSWSYIMY